MVAMVMMLFMKMMATIMTADGKEWLKKNDQKDQEDDQTYQIIVKVGVDRSSWSWPDKIALIHDLQPLNPT